MNLLKDLQQAIDLEQQQKNKDFQEIMELPLKERENKGYTLSNVSIQEIDFYEASPNQYCPILSNEKKYINTIKIHCEHNRSKFREGSKICISKGDYKFLMTIDNDLIDDMMLISEDFEIQHNYIDCQNYPRDGWEINAVNLTANQRLLNAARDKICNDTELCGRLESLFKGEWGSRYEDVLIDPSNNKSQDTAVRKSLGCNYFHLIQGPPGTGKTYTLAKIVKGLLDKGYKILVTGPTHTSINNSLNAISTFVQDPTKIVKIGEKYQATEIFPNQYVTRKRRFPYPFDFQETKLFENGIVIGATPYACCYPASKKLANWNFDYVIIDEAAQMSMPLALAAISYGKKLIFLGDHKQLDPIMPTNSANWLFSKSVFKYLVDLYPQDSTFLDTSYRLSPSLIKIPSELFYHGKLKSDKKTTDNNEFLNFSCEFYPEIVNDSSNAILYVHKDYDGLGRSIFEAEMVAKIVKDLNNNNISNENIAIISPYRAQVREIKRQLIHLGVLQADDLGSIFVDTIERMQGQEKDYVIFSLANSNPMEIENRLEFFYSASRLNVAITRAKKKYIAIANRNIFKICNDELKKDNNGLPSQLIDGMAAYSRFFELSYKIEAEEQDEW